MRVNIGRGIVYVATMMRCFKRQADQLYSSFVSCRGETTNVASSRNGKLKFTDPEVKKPQEKVNK